MQLKSSISRLFQDPPSPAVLESLWDAVIAQSRETTELPQFFTLRIWLLLAEFLPFAAAFPPILCRFAEATLDAALALPAGLDKDGLSRAFLLALRRQRGILAGAGFPAVKRLLEYEAMSSNVAPFLLLWLEEDCGSGAKDDNGAKSAKGKPSDAAVDSPCDPADAAVAQSAMEERMAVGRFVVRNVYQSRVKSDYLALLALLLHHADDQLPRLVGPLKGSPLVHGAGGGFLHRSPRGDVAE